MTADEARKLTLLHAWLTWHAQYRFELHAGGPVDTARAVQAVAAHGPGRQDSVYVLVRARDPLTPLYVGRTDHPVRRWREHLRGCEQGVSRYVPWAPLFGEALDLYVVPVAGLRGPPIPGFPVTSDAVEMQLVRLAQGPGSPLINREGVGRAQRPSGVGGDLAAPMIWQNPGAALLPWLAAQPGVTAPLFSTEADGLTVQTHTRGTRVVLTRHPAFDAAMTEVVEAGLPRSDWDGLLYVMFTPGAAGPTLRYVGKAEKAGRTHSLSVNLARIRGNHGKFGRWGYDAAYHVGDLSEAVLGGGSSGAPKYAAWRDALFTGVGSRTLRRPVCVQLIPWQAGMRGPSGLLGSVADVEYELIALASLTFGRELLNVQGRQAAGGPTPG